MSGHVASARYTKARGLPCPAPARRPSTHASLLKAEGESTTTTPTRQPITADSSARASSPVWLPWNTRAVLSPPSESWASRAQASRSPSGLLQQMTTSTQSSGGGAARSISGCAPHIPTTEPSTTSSPSARHTLSPADDSGPDEVEGGTSSLIPADDPPTVSHWRWPPGPEALPMSSGPIGRGLKLSVKLRLNSYSGPGLSSRGLIERSSLFSFCSLFTSFCATRSAEASATFSASVMDDLRVSPLKSSLLHRRLLFDLDRGDEGLRPLAMGERGLGGIPPGRFCPLACELTPQPIVKGRAMEDGVDALPPAAQTVSDSHLWPQQPSHNCPCSSRFTRTRAGRKRPLMSKGERGTSRGSWDAMRGTKEVRRRRESATPRRKGVTPLLSSREGRETR
mmetsp:Transcript_59017/g.188510  ORF Transcript_59017/g.188510 Transcript_59017/m.188510 type:complete len:396 (+) Transcript_59017:233-1420(+)